MATLEHKVVPPILQAEPAACRNDARAKTHVVGVDKAAGVAISVHHTKIHCVLRPACGGGRGALVRVRHPRRWRTHLNSNGKRMKGVCGNSNGKHMKGVCGNIASNVQQNVYDTVEYCARVTGVCIGCVSQSCMGYSHTEHCTKA